MRNEAYYLKQGALNHYKKSLKATFNKVGDRNYECSECGKTWINITDNGIRQAVGHFRKRHQLRYMELRYGYNQTTKKT